MQNYSFSIVIQIWHPSIDPAVITAKLGMEPKRACLAGTRRHTPNGQPLDGTYSESYWYTDPFQRGEYTSTDIVAEEALQQVFDLLIPHATFLLLLREQGARIHLKLSSFSLRNYAIELTPEFLVQFGTIGVSFVHDVYPYAQNW